MNFQTIRKYCLDKKGVNEGFPLGDSVMVMKVGSKMFATLSQEDNPLSINLKCDPFRAEDLRLEYEAVTPGYHMNKRHWNTVVIDGSVPDKLIFNMIDHSCDLAFASLKKSEREEITGSK